MELHRFFRYAIEKMCKEKKSLNHFIVKEALVYTKGGQQYVITLVFNIDIK